jgi:uncharacterized BrkB/YihY/UPF0761 family membrane protein
MSSWLTKLEKTLQPIFKGTPPLSKGGREWLVKAWPVLALVFGVLQLLLAINLWRFAHSVDHFVDYANQIARTYGNGDVVHHLGLFYWLALLSLFVDGAILLMAFPHLKARRKQGWDLLFLGATLNLLYGLFSAFDTYYGGVSKFIGTIIGSAVAYYLLFQVRELYGASHKPSAVHKEPAK